jgi:acetyl esterase
LPRRLERRAALAMMRLPDAAIRRLAGPPTTHESNVLDPRVQLAIRLSRVLRKKEAPVLGVAAYRRELDAMGTTLAPDPPSLAEVQNLSITSANGASARARLYVPHGVPTPSPGLVYFHGGGFVAGSLESHDPVCRELAIGAQCRVLSVEYRLAPEHPFPAAADDGEAAFAYATSHAEALGFDPARIAIGGDSAGGNVTAVAALAARGRAPAPIAQLLIYPAVDMTMSARSHETLGHGFFLEHETILWFRDRYLPPGTDRKHPRASPLFAEDVRGAAPAIVVTAGFDPLRDEGMAYAQKLRDAGVPVVERCYGSLFHGFINATGGIEAAAAAVDEIATELGRLLSAGRT